MAKERLHELKQTAATFQIRGVVTGTKGKRFYNSGTSKSGGTWNAIEFGLQINSGKTVFIKLNGFPRSEVYYYKRPEKGEKKGSTVSVPWKNRKQAPGEGFRLIGVNISTGKDDDGKNVNEMFTEFDAVEYLHENLNDGDSLFVKGNVQFSTYTTQNGEVKKSIDLVPTQISYTQSPVDFNADDFEEEALFDNTLVFSGIDKEVDEDGKQTKRFVLSGYSVSYNDVVPVSFIIDENHSKLAGNLKKRMKPGYAIHTFGKIDVIVDTEFVDSAEDDGWGESSKMERINRPAHREYQIFKADPNSIDEETYSEKAIKDAIRKIKAAKEAEKNFSGNATANEDTSGWGSDDDDGEEPW